MATKRGNDKVNWTYTWAEHKVAFFSIGPNEDSILSKNQKIAYFAFRAERSCIYGLEFGNFVDQILFVWKFVQNGVLQ